MLYVKNFTLWPLATTFLLSTPVCLTCIDYTYKRDHTIFFFLFGLFHRACPPGLSKLSHIIFLIFMGELKSIVWIHYFIFIYSSINRHIFFCILAIANNAAINIGVKISCWDPAFIFFGFKTKSDIVDHMVVLLSIYNRTSMLLFVCM